MREKQSKSRLYRNAFKIFNCYAVKLIITILHAYRKSLNWMILNIVKRMLKRYTPIQKSKFLAI